MRLQNEESCLASAGTEVYSNLVLRPGRVHDRMTGLSDNLLLFWHFWYTLGVQKDQDNLQEISCHAPGSYMGSEQGNTDLSSVLHVHLS